MVLLSSQQYSLFLPLLLRIRFVVDAFWKILYYGVPLNESMFYHHRRWEGKTWYSRHQSVDVKSIYTREEDKHTQKAGK